MKKLVGKVVEVFIPKEYKCNQEIDIMESNKLGFHILIDQEIYEFIVEQNEINSIILKDDQVIVRIQNISGKEFVDIEKDGDEVYE